MTWMTSRTGSASWSPWTSGDHFELATLFVVANPTPSGGASRSGRAGRAGVGHDGADGASADPVSSCRPSEPDLHLYHSVRPNRLCPTQPVAGARLAGVASAAAPQNWGIGALPRPRGAGAGERGFGVIFAGGVGTISLTAIPFNSRSEWLRQPCDPVEAIHGDELV